MLVTSYTDPLKPDSIRFSDGGESLYYRLAVAPSGAATDTPVDTNHTLIFFVGGSGCHSLKYYMRDYFAPMPPGYSVFALQKRGVDDRTTGLFGCSTRFYERDCFSQWVTDQSEFVDRVLAGLTMRPRHVVLFGVSEGGSVAAAVAARHPEVTHLVVIGSGGMRQVEELRLLAQRGQFDSHMDERFRSVRADPDNAKLMLYGHSFRYWSSVLDRDPLQLFSRVTVPILLGFGEADRSVPVEAARALEEDFKRRGRSNLKLVVYPGADHALRARGHAYRSDFLKLMAEWLEGR